MIGGPWHEWLAYFVLCCVIIVVIMKKVRSSRFFYSVFVIPPIVFIGVFVSEIVLNGMPKFLFLTPMIWFFISMGLSGLYCLSVKRAR